jgi:uncharacterized protein YjdB
VSWSSSNTPVATVANGVVTAVVAGTATITVTTADGNKTATCTVTVNSTATIAVSSVTLNQTSATLNVGGTLTLTPTVLPANATNKAVTWSSSNSAIATVTDNGTVIALTTGTAVIIATTQDGGKVATCTVTVTQQATGVEAAEVSLVSMYPNPVTNGELRVDLSTDNEQWTMNNGGIEIYSLSGTLVSRHTTAGETTTIDVSQLAKGVYLVKVGSKVGKIVKE